MKKLIVLSIAVLLVLALAIPSMAGLSISGKWATVVGYNGDTESNKLWPAAGISINPSELDLDFVGNSILFVNLNFTSQNFDLRIPMNTGVLGATQQYNKLQLNGGAYGDTKTVTLDITTQPFFLRAVMHGDDPSTLWNTTADPLQLVNKNRMPSYTDPSKQLVFGGMYNGLKVDLQVTDKGTSAVPDGGDLDPVVPGGPGGSFALTLTTNMLGGQYGYLFTSNNGHIKFDHGTGTMLDPNNTPDDPTDDVEDPKVYIWDTNNVSEQELWTSYNLPFGKLTAAIAAEINIIDQTTNGIALFSSLTDVNLFGFNADFNVVAREVGFSAPLACNGVFSADGSAQAGPISYTFKSGNEDIKYDSATYDINYDNAKLMVNGWFNKWVFANELTRFTYTDIPDRTEWVDDTVGRLRFVADGSNKVDLFGAKTNLNIYNIYASGYGDGSSAMYDALGMRGDFKTKLFDMKTSVLFNGTFITSLADDEFTAIPVLVNTTTSINKKASMDNNFHLLSWSKAADSGFLFDYIGSLTLNGSLLKGLNQKFRLDAPIGADEATDDRLGTYGITFRANNDYKTTVALGFIPEFTNTLSAYLRANQVASDNDPYYVFVFGETINMDITSDLSMTAIGASAHQTNVAAANNYGMYPLGKLNRYGFWLRLDQRMSDNAALSLIANGFKANGDTYTGYFAPWYGGGKPAEMQNGEGIRNLFISYSVATPAYGFDVMYGKFPVSSSDDWIFANNEGWANRSFAQVIESYSYELWGEKANADTESSFYTRDGLFRVKAWIKF